MPSPKKSPVETTFLRQIRKAKLPTPEREHVFDEPKEGQKQRKWRFDFAWIKHKVAAEVEGGVWSRGRHVTPAGFEKDCEKYGHAMAQGWKVLRVTSRMVKNGLGIRLLKQILQPVFAC